MTTAVLVPLKVKLRGAVAKLRDDLLGYQGEPAVLRYLVEGPAGTGKSRGIGHVLYALMQQYPGIRVLFIRKTRASLTESFLITWEEQCLAPGDCALEGAGRNNRHSYTVLNPTGGKSEAICAGLDQPTRHYSAQYDIVYVQEGTEITRDEYEKFYRMLRNWGGGIPFQALIVDCNPDVDTHFLNRMCSDGTINRLISRHVDNPALYAKRGGQFEQTPRGKAYMQQLERLTGIRRRRLYLGEWCAAEGGVWETYDAAVNLIDAPQKPDGFPDYTALGLKDYLGSMDWGYDAPGVLQVWGRDGDKRMTRVAEVYHTKKTSEWWAERVCDVDDEFGLLRVMCDPARPDLISEVNAWLVKMGHPALCEPANNKRASSPGGDLAGLDLVRWGFEKDETGTPRLRLLRNASRWGVDQDLRDASLPICTEDEIPGYVFLRRTNSERATDQTDPDCPDHGCDAMRYACAENWKRRAPIDPVVPQFKPRSLGSILDHASEFKRTRRVRV